MSGIPLQKVLFMRSMPSRAIAKRAMKKTKVDRVLAKHEGPLAVAISKVLREKGKSIARQLRGRYEHHMKAVPSWVDDLADEVDSDGVGIAVRDVLTTTIESIFKQAGLTAIAEVDQEATGAMLQHMDVEALQWATSRGADLVTDISSTTRDGMRDLTATAVEEGLSPQEFASSIEDSFAFSAERSTMIARTELAFAQVQGNLSGYKASGVVEKKQWLASDAACDICEAADGTEVALDDTFTIDGEDVDGPPVHPNCRCDVIPVLSEGDE